MALPHTRGALQTGMTLEGRFRVGLRIGGGAVTTLYAATDRNGEGVAIEVLDTALIVGPTTRERFVESGLLANSIGHAQVARVLLDGATPTGEPFVVLDLREGESLEPYRMRGGGTLAVSEVVDLLAQLFEVLETAHARGTFHGALGTSSLFVETNGRLRVLDFGFTGLALDGRPSARGDLRAAGATAFYLLTGTPVNAALLERVADVVLGIPQEVAQVIDFAMYGPDQDPRMNAATLRQALERLQPRLRRLDRPVGPDDQTKEVRVVDQLLASEILDSDDATARGRLGVSPSYAIDEASLTPLAPPVSYPPPALGSRPPPSMGQGYGLRSPTPMTNFASRPPPSMGSLAPHAYGSTPSLGGSAQTTGRRSAVVPVRARLSTGAILVVALVVLAAIVAAFLLVRAG